MAEVSALQLSPHDAGCALQGNDPCRCCILAQVLCGLYFPANMQAPHHDGMHSNPFIAPHADPALTTSHTAGDPGFARAQRAHLRRQQQDQGALADALRVSTLASGWVRKGMPACSWPSLAWRRHDGNYWTAPCSKPEP